jgi:hypothetical protein
MQQSCHRIQMPCQIVAGMEMVCAMRMDRHVAIFAFDFLSSGFGINWCIGTHRFSSC